MTGDENVNTPEMLTGESGRYHLKSTHWAAILVLVFIWLCLAWFFSDYYPPGTFNDDGAYVMQARSLAREGRLLFQSGFLPGWPLLMAPLVFISGDSLTPLRIFNMLLLLAAAGLFIAIAIPRLGLLCALLVGACFLVNSVSLRFASTLLSDPSFTFLVALTLYCSSRSTAGWSAGLSGFLAGLATVVRIAAAPVALMVVLSFALKRRWKEALYCAAGGLTIAFLALPVFLHYIMNAAAKPGTGSLSTFAFRFITITGFEFIGIPSGAAELAAAVVLGLAVWGWFRLAESRQFDAWMLAVPAYIALISLWPFVTQRYILPLWPLILILAAFALRKYPRVQIGFLVVIALCPLPGLVQLGKENARRAESASRRFSSYAWLKENTSQSSSVWSMFPWRTRLLADRRGPASTACASMSSELIYSIASGDADYVIYEPYAAAVLPDGSGYRPAPNADLWLDCSSHLKGVFSTEWDKVYQWQGSRKAYCEAYDTYRRGVTEMEKGDLKSAENSFRMSLGRDPDIPEARSLLAWIILQKSSLPPPEAIALLEENLRSYPVDMESAYNLALAYRAAGRFDRARDLLKDSLVTIRKLGLPRYEALFSRTIDEMTKK